MFYEEYFEVKSAAAAYLWLCSAVLSSG